MLAEDIVCGKIYYYLRKADDQFVIEKGLLTESVEFVRKKTYYRFAKFTSQGRRDCNTMMDGGCFVLDSVVEPENIFSNLESIEKHCRTLSLDVLYGAWIRRWNENNPCALCSVFKEEEARALSRNNSGADAAIDMVVFERECRKDCLFDPIISHAELRPPTEEVVIKDVCYD